jgi:hypothetical protein
MTGGGGGGPHIVREPGLGRAYDAPRPMTDLWILALTVGFFGAAAWFVRVCERM